MSGRVRMMVALGLMVLVVGLGVSIVVQHYPAAGVDSSTLRWVFDHRTSWATRSASALSTVFAPIWVAIATVIGAFGLIRRDRRLERGARILGAVMLAGVVAEALKLGVDRLRPPAIYQVGAPELAMSFPSGHVTGICALVFAAAAAGGARNAAIAAATLVTAAVAASRLYLGAHWLTDVLASVGVALASVLAAPMVVDPVIDWMRPHLPVRLQPMVDAGEGTQVAEHASTC
ncbi:phosphatase PAP2 family protein [Gordonia polyisoprenivorans]|uniref:phosphatase PAP2 family protein n=1 Tax=Gordonia polyisoprenivorans TaxID=84595 RepID=UPI002011F449|nr:phosphatase PAP2 family protein [Gordonia polyisoprenivorans]